MERWELVGGPEGGTVPALAASPAFADDNTFFAATMAGLFRWHDGEKRWQQVGEALPGPFLTAVALSPDFAHDSVILVASLEGGLFRSTDGGQTWTTGNLAGRRVNISALKISPNFSRDSTTFVGTIADGVFRSGDRGATWEARNFGLLDLNVLDLAHSPAFGRDETIFAATATGVFCSQNDGRAWRAVTFPPAAAPVQCLAVSPNFAEDGTIFAGTEAAGIFRSTDRGKTWQPMNGPLADACVNALVISPGFGTDRTILATTESAIYVSRDAGESWSRCAELPGALCLALAPTFPDGGPVLVGLSQSGVYRSAGSLSKWQPANDGLSGRMLTGLVLSPTFADDRQSLVFGPSDGVLRSGDGGVTWTEINLGLPSMQVNDLALAQAPSGESRLYAALPQGVWLSHRWGEAWEQVSGLPAQVIALSPDFARDATLVVGTKGQGLWISHDEGHAWRSMDVRWQGQDTLALTLSPAFSADRHIFVVVGQPDGGSFEVWRGRLAGPWEPVIRHPGPARGAVLAIPNSFPQDGQWYAAIGDQFYRPMAGAVVVEKRKRLPLFVGTALARECPTVIDLAALPAPQGSHLLAATDRGLYLWAEGREAWRPLNPGEATRPVVAVVPSPDFRHDRSVYGLELGGTLWRLRLPMKV